jgi:hypothetical protein
MKKEERRRLRKDKVLRLVSFVVDRVFEDCSRIKISPAYTVLTQKFSSILTGTPYLSSTPYIN